LLKDFYVRRVFRIFPAFYTYIAAARAARAARAAIPQRMTLDVCIASRISDRDLAN